MGTVLGLWYLVPSQTGLLERKWGEGERKEEQEQRRGEKGKGKEGEKEGGNEGQLAIA